MAVLMVKTYDRHQSIQPQEQTELTRTYPVLSSGCVTNLKGQELIERWVNVIKNRTNCAPK